MSSPEREEQARAGDQAAWRARAVRAIEAGLGEHWYEPEVNRAEWEPPPGVEPDSEAAGDHYLAWVDAQKERQEELDRAAVERLAEEDPDAYQRAYTRAEADMTIAIDAAVRSRAAESRRRATESRERAILEAETGEGGADGTRSETGVIARAIQSCRLATAARAARGAVTRRSARTRDIDPPYPSRAVPLREPPGRG